MKKLISEDNMNKLKIIFGTLIWSFFVVLLMAIECSGQSKYFKFLKSRSAQLDEKASKLEVVALEDGKYILTRDTTENGTISFVYTPLADVFEGLKERYDECDKELEKIGIELETLKMRRKVLLEKKARIEFLMSQE